jgi:hydroxymethylglutaryl-CoA lyase
MQGIKDFIPTAVKVAYINKLLKVGFDTIDFGSFVSPKAIPQMADTSLLVKQLNLTSTSSKLLSIIANKRGAEESAAYDEISYLGYPFSVSETFQLRNTNATVDESLLRVEEIQKICQSKNKTLVVYLSMGFGNPYGDPWSGDIVTKWCERLYNELDVKIMALSDTIGVSNNQNIRELFSNLIPELPGVEFGAHLHTTPDTYLEKIKAAVESGCHRFDGAIKGYGGCPMATDKLTGNMPTELMLNWFQQNGYTTNIDNNLFFEAMEYSNNVFTHTV